MSVGGSSSKSKSRPLSPGQLGAYFSYLDDLTGDRLGTFAREGTPRLSPEQIQSLGGLGATRRSELERARGRAVDEILADPNLSIAQRQRSRQLTDDDFNARADAIAKETEAAITSLARDENLLNREDLALLAEIYFGGKGQSSSSRSGGFGIRIGK